MFAALICVHTRDIAPNALPHTPTLHAQQCALLSPFTGLLDAAHFSAHIQDCARRASQLLLSARMM